MNNRLSRSDRYNKIVMDFLNLPVETEDNAEISLILYSGEARRLEKKYPIDIIEVPDGSIHDKDKKRYVIRRKE